MCIHSHPHFPLLSLSLLHLFSSSSVPLLEDSFTVYHRRCSFNENCSLLSSRYNLSHNVFKTKQTWSWKLCSSALCINNRICEVSWSGEEGEERRRGRKGREGGIVKENSKFYHLSLTFTGWILLLIINKWTATSNSGFNFGRVSRPEMRWLATPTWHTHPHLVVGYSIVISQVESNC